MVDVTFYSEHYRRGVSYQTITEDLYTYDLESICIQFNKKHILKWRVESMVQHAIASERVEPMETFLLGCLSTSTYKDEIDISIVLAPNFKPGEYYASTLIPPCDETEIDTSEVSLVSCQPKEDDTGYKGQCEEEIDFDIVFELFEKEEIKMESESSHSNESEISNDFDLVPVQLHHQNFRNSMIVPAPELPIYNPFTNQFYGLNDSSYSILEFEENDGVGIWYKVA